MNVIFIMIDSLRQDHVGIYNQGKEIFSGIPACKTPNLDKFSKDCIIFENVYPCGLATIPVRYELMTGYFSLPYRSWCPLTSYDITVSSILQREDYFSGIISDTYHYRAPEMNYHRDFNIYRWVRGQEYDPYNIPKSKRRVEDYINKNYTEIWKNRIEQFLANTDYLDEKTWFTSQVVEKSIDFLKKTRDFKKTFLWVDSFEPHEPWDPPKKFDIYTNKDYKGPRLILPMGGEAKTWATDEEINHIRGLYTGEVSFVDDILGNLFQEIERLGYFENSLIVVTADHGHPLADHGKFLKGTDRLFSELLKVPFMIKFPKGQYAGRRIKSLIQFPDVLPTILEIIGYKNETNTMVGKSFYNVIKGETDKHREATLTGYFRGIERCIRTEQWSYVQTNRGEPDMLFDLQKDPKETNNLIDTYPEIAKEMFSKFGNIYKAKVSCEVKGLQGMFEMGSASIE